MYSIRKKFSTSDFKSILSYNLNTNLNSVLFLIFFQFFIFITFLYYDKIFKKAIEKRIGLVNLDLLVYIQ